MAAGESGEGLPRRARALALLSAHRVVHSLAKLVPRSPRYWLFGYQEGLFLGNPKLLFLWISLHRPDMTVTWITDHGETRAFLRRNGYRAHGRWSPGGVLAALRAGVYVYAHGLRTVNLSLSGGAFLLNLWHGVGLKGVKYGFRRGANSEPEQLKPANIVERWAQITYLLPPDNLVTTSDFTQRHFAEQFRLPVERCPQLGYPRLDCASDPRLLERVEELDRQLGFRFNPRGSREVYIYMPTFRDTARPFVEEALPDLGRLSDALRARDATLYVKLHPYTRTDMSFEHGNIIEWPDEIDVHGYLQRFTGLITDYSSILYDYLFVRDAGAILYTFDYDEYLANDRSLLYPFDENVAGLRVSTFDELCRALEEGSSLSPGLAPKAREVTRKFWGGSARPASRAVVDHVLGLLGGGGAPSR